MGSLADRHRNSSSTKRCRVLDSRRIRSSIKALVLLFTVYSRGPCRTCSILTIVASELSHRWLVRICAGHLFLVRTGFATLLCTLTKSMCTCRSLSPHILPWCSTRSSLLHTDHVHMFMPQPRLPCCPHILPRCLAAVLQMLVAQA